MKGSYPEDIKILYKPLEAGKKKKKEKWAKDRKRQLTKKKEEEYKI